MDGICANSNGRSKEEFNVEEWVPVASVNAADIDSFVGVANMP
jgi:hypothetical protein